MIYIPDFNRAQKEAVEFKDGTACVLAGPGSGKTTVITHRVKNLIENCGVLPEHILVITFTKAAANEMKQRFRALCTGDGAAVTFGTFHAVYFTILKHAYHYTSESIILPDRQREFVLDYLRKLSLEFSCEDDAVSNVLSEISIVKNGQLDISEYEPFSCPKGSFNKIYKAYDDMLVRKRLIDFDDMVLETYRLFVNRSDYLNAWQDKYRYILIDEFQDINQAQFDVIKLLSAKYGNLFVVGDDDQSIYGFRGSKPEIMLKFKESFPEAEMISMNVNYRSDSAIVDTARSVIEMNKMRYAKDLKAFFPRELQDEEDDYKVIIYETDNLEKEKNVVLNEIKNLHEQGIRYSDISVLSRTNTLNNIFLNKFTAEGIPCVSDSCNMNIYETWLARDIISYLRMGIGERRRSIVLRIVNKPMRYITREYIPEVFSFEGLRDIYSEELSYAQRGQYASLPSYSDNYYVKSNNSEMIRIINDFQFDINMLRHLSPFAAVNYIRKSIGYDEYLDDYIREHRVDREGIIGLCDEITEQAKRFTNIREWLAYIDNSNDCNKNAEGKNAGKKNDDSVHFHTMHCSKGLEYKYVFITDVCEGIIPYGKAVLSDEVEEERRMFYVAMTRAKEKLYLLYPLSRYNKSTACSRFIEEMNKDNVKVFHINEDYSLSELSLLSSSS
ncbi:MAG: ATP-dependent helicase [Lachnospira sp.]